MGEGESAITERPFHIMKAVERIRPKLSSCAAACRGFWSAESMVGAWGSRGREVVFLRKGAAVARRRESFS